MSMFQYGPEKGLETQYAATQSLGITGTTETSVLPVGVGNKMIPANWFLAGYNARLVIRGTVTTPLVAGTATVRVKVGGTTIVSATTSSLLGSLTSQAWAVICNIQSYTPGVSGTFGVAGEVRYPSGLLGVGMGSQPLNSTSVVFDSTVQQSVDVTMQWSLASHTATTTIATLELMSL